MTAGVLGARRRRAGGPPGALSPIVVSTGAALLAAAVTVPLVGFLALHPRALPALAIAAPALVLIVARPAWIPAVYLAFVWAALGPETLGGLPSPADVGAIAMMAASAWFVLRERRLAKEVMLVCALLALPVLASGLVAVDGPSLGIDPFKDLVFLFVVAFCVRDERAVERTAIALAVVGLVLGAGSAYAVHNGAFGPFTVAEPVGPLDPSVPRASGLIFGDANFFALSLATLVPLTMYLVGRGGWRAGLGIVALTGQLAGILASGSRGGLLAAAFAAVAWALAAGSRRMRTASLVAVACGALLVPFFSTQLSAGASRDVSDRLNENHIALVMWTDRPLTGVGPGRYPDLFRDYSRRIGNDPRYDRSPHSLPLQILAEQGIFGALGWIAAAFLVIRRIRSTGLWQRTIGRALVVALGTYMVGSLFLHGSQLRMPYILVGLVYALGEWRGGPQLEERA